MATTIRRKLYRRGSSYETTVPMPLLFALDKDKRHEVLFTFDPVKKRWYIKFQEAEESSSPGRKRKRR